MGLDALVHCRCAIDGRARRSPSPFVLAEEGLVCDESLGLDELLAFDRWLQDGCSHPGMHYRFTHISNWADYRRFQARVQRVGPHHFPTLHSELPNANGGWTSCSQAASSLDELAQLVRSTEEWPVVKLVDVDSGVVVAERVDAYDGVLVLDGTEGWRASLADDITFYVHGGSADPTVLFRAAEFTQIQIGDGSWKWTAPSGASFSCSNGLPIYNDEGTPSWPSYLRVVEGRGGVADVRPVTEALRDIFEASVAIDMPVHWM